MKSTFEYFDWTGIVSSGCTVNHNVDIRRKRFAILKACHLSTDLTVASALMALDLFPSSILWVYLVDSHTKAPRIILPVGRDTVLRMSGLKVVKQDLR